MSIFTDLFSGGAGNLVNSVGNAIDKIVTTKEEKMQIELEMKKAEMQYQVDMKKLSIQEQQMIYQDVASARTMASNVQTSSSATRFSKNISPILALSTTALTFVLFYMIFFQKQ